MENILPNERAQKDLLNRLDKLVQEFLSDHLEYLKHSPKIRGPKAIHDSLLGTNLFQPHEIVVLDTPLLQRLRQISQTGLSFYIYPCATHSRFEHTLGVIVLATRFVNKINEGKTPKIIDDDPLTGDLAAIRMAALLHDVGHGICSHVSEQVYEWFDEMQDLRSQDKFTHCKPHEILSYHIVKTPTFRKFFEEYVLSPYPVKINLDRVAELIIGRVPEDDNRSFLADIINGPFDADKLDYIARDSYFTGLRLTIDLDRLFYTVDVKTFPDNKQRLVVCSPVPLEQILFSKMMLFSSVYHHHKVKSCDTLFQGLFEYIWQEGISFRNLEFTDYIDFLRITDHDLFNFVPVKDTNIQGIINSFLHRKFFKRALVICRDTVDNWDTGISHKIERLANSPLELLLLREKIQDCLRQTFKKSCSLHQIWVSLPKLPSLREASQTYVVMDKRKKLREEPPRLNQLFPADGWVRAYGDKQWRGHIFGPPYLQEELHKAAKEVLTNEGFILNRKSAEYCHLYESDL